MVSGSLAAAMFHFNIATDCNIKRMALKGLQVLELAGLAPAPFAGLILAGQWNGYLH